MVFFQSNAYLSVLIPSALPRSNPLMKELSKSIALCRSPGFLKKSVVVSVVVACLGDIKQKFKNNGLSAAPPFQVFLIRTLILNPLRLTTFLSLVLAVWPCAIDVTLPP